MKLLPLLISDLCTIWIFIKLYYINFILRKILHMYKNFSRVIFSTFINWRVSGKIVLRELMRYASAIAIYATIITVISYIR